MTGPLAPAVPVLDVLRLWASVYRRWWDHPCRQDGLLARPWSAADEELVARLDALDTDELMSMASELRRVAADLATAEAELATAASGGEMPSPVEYRCRAVATAVGGYRADAALLADSLYRAADGIEMLLEALVRRVLRVAAGLVEANPYPSVGLAHQEIDAADRARRGTDDPHRWRSLDQLVERQGAVLTVLRAGLAEVVDQFGTVHRDVWCDGDNGCPVDWWAEVDRRTEVDQPAKADQWAEVDWAEADQRSESRGEEQWRALPVNPVPRAGNGPVLAGTEGSRPGTETGVRIAQLPDRPPG